MRRYRRSRRNRKQRKLLILGVCCIFLFMTAGYAAMQTELNINAKGNVVKKATAGSDLVEMVGMVNSGDGLYKDSYEQNVYTYRGSNPNNYIMFNNEPWRIVSINTSDNTIKIIRSEVLEDRAFHSYACSTAYNINEEEEKKDKNGTYQINRINYLAPGSDAVACNKWNEPAELNTYLNGTYYSSTLSSTAQGQIVEGWFNVGPVSSSSSYTLTQNIEQSKVARWQGKIGLIDATEYVKASTNSACDSVYDFSSTSSCYNSPSNYLNISDEFWTISPYLDSFSYNVFSVRSSGDLLGLNYAAGSNGVRPVLNLSPDIQITGGDGLQNNPYTIS